MKATTKQELIVGVAFTSAMLLLGFYTIVTGNLMVGTKLYVVDFNPPGVYGLKRGDPVRVEGHEVGDVKEIRLLPPVDKQPGRIRAVIEVDDKVEIYREGGKVRVTPFSPLGGRVVEISRGYESPQGKYSEYTSGMKDQEVEGVAILGEAEGEILQNLNSLIEANSKNVKKIVDNLATVSERLTKTDNVLGYLINDEGGGKKIDQIASNLTSASRRVDELLARADRGDSALGVFVSDRDPKVRADVAGIVADVKVVTGAIADKDSGGSLSKLVHDGRLYDAASDTAENLASITKKVDEGHGLLGVLTEDQAGQDARDTLKHLASITKAVDDPEQGAIGLLIKDKALRNRVGRVVEEIERLVVEFRDSLEDVREQAPVNAFIGAVFAAF